MKPILPLLLLSVLLFSCSSVDENEFEAPKAENDTRYNVKINVNGFSESFEDFAPLKSEATDYKIDSVGTYLYIELPYENAGFHPLNSMEAKFYKADEQGNIIIKDSLKAGKYQMAIFANVKTYARNKRGEAGCMERLYTSAPIIIRILCISN